MVPYKIDPRLKSKSVFCFTKKKKKKKKVELKPSYQVSPVVLGKEQISQVLEI